MSHAIDELLDLDAPLVLYVGAALPESAGLPSRSALVQTLLTEAEDMLSVRQHRELTELAQGPELALVFSELERALTPAAFGRIVERALDDDEVAVPPLGQAIGALKGRLRGVVTPNLDQLVERSFMGALTVHPTPVPDLASRSGWLLKIHGTLHDRSTWVLTEEQQGRVLHRDPMHREIFRSLFLAHPVLFVGTSLDDPVLGELLGQIKALAQGQPPRHWALVDAEDAGPIKRRRAAAAGVELIPCEGETGCLEALAMLARGGKRAGEVSSPAPSAPSASARPAPANPAPAGPSPANPVPTASPAASGTTGISVLFLAANPAGTDPLRLDRELRVIREAIERSRHRDALHLEIRPAATVHDLRRALLESQYDVVHVSGHGEEEGLLLEDEQGECIQIPRQAVARLFARYAPPRGSLRCVVLNACWSRATGEEASMQVPFTVAMDGPISDRGALEFSRGFYDALGAGLDYEVAYEEGCSSVELAAPGARFEALLLRG